MLAAPQITEDTHEGGSEEQNTQPLREIGESFDQISLSDFTVNEHVSRGRAIEEREMFFLHSELDEGVGTRLVRGVLAVAGGSGRSQVGGIPALRGVKGEDLLMRLASLMIIIQLLQLIVRS